MRNRIDEKEFARLARELSVDVSVVRSVVHSYFDSLSQQARKLPFNNPRRIFTKNKFSEYEYAQNIPYIGRLGPSYSRYLTWRANEAKNMELAYRRDFKTIYTPEQIESLADKVLHDWNEGDPKIERPENKQTYPFKRIWLVGKKGKKQARQVIPNKNVQD